MVVAGTVRLLSLFVATLALLTGHISSDDDAPILFLELDLDRRRMQLDQPTQRQNVFGVVPASRVPFAFEPRQPQRIFELVQSFSSL
jgi:hypothetical protein